MMSRASSGPRGAPGLSTPSAIFRAALGEDTSALLDTYGVAKAPLAELDLTPGLIARVHAERDDAPLA